MKKLFLVTSLSLVGLVLNPKNVLAESYTCGEKYNYNVNSTSCDCANDEPIGYGWHCCGWWKNRLCLAQEPDDGGDGEDGSTSSEPIFPDITTDDLKDLNPLIQLGDDDENTDPSQALHTEDGSLNPSGVINRALNLLFPLAGIALFVMIVWGGFEMLTGAAKKQALDSGKQRITAALIGFTLLFASYWLAQIIEAITGVVILG